MSIPRQFPARAVCSTVLRNPAFTFARFQRHSWRKTYANAGECGKRNGCFGFPEFDVFTVSGHDSTPLLRRFCFSALNAVQWSIKFLAILRSDNTLRNVISGSRVGMTLNAMKCS